MNRISQNITQRNMDSLTMSFAVRVYMGLVVRKSDFVACKQQRSRPACADAQSDQRLCYSLSVKLN